MRRRRWAERGPSERSVERRLVAVSMVAIGLGASIGFLWGYVAIDLRADLGLSRAEIGGLVSIYFGATGLGSIAGGVIADRLGARLAVAANLAVVAVASLAVVLVPRYAVLAGASLVAGAAYSLGNAGTNIAIAAAVPSERRATALTIKTAGVPTMAVVASVLAPWTADRFGWSIGFLVVTVGAIVACVVTLRVLPAAGREAIRVAPRAAVAALPRGFVLMPIASLLLIAGSQPLFSWIVPFLQEDIGLAPGSAGLLASSAAAVGVCTMILVAARSDRGGAARRSATVTACTAVTALAVLLTAGAGVVGTPAALIGVAIGTACQLAAVGVLHATVVDAAPTAIGRASGVTMTGYYLGALLAPAGFGAIVDHTGSYAAGWGVCAVLLTCSAVAFQRARVALRAA